MRNGISADALRRSVLDALASRAEATSVIAVAPTMPTAGDSPIVRRARERARRLAPDVKPKQRRPDERHRPEQLSWSREQA
jgi:hypothetical protein